MTLDNIQPGASLARDVVDANGNCLLAAGAELSKNTLALLQRRGIKGVAIVCESKLTAEQWDDLQQAIEQQLARRFRNTQENPHMQQLHALLKEYRLGEFLE